MDFGEGQSPVNWPTRARSVRDRATWISLSGGREILGISSSFFTNFAASPFFFFGKDASGELKVSASEGGGGGGRPLGCDQNLHGCEEAIAPGTTQSNLRGASRSR